MLVQLLLTLLKFTGRKRNEERPVLFTKKKKKKPTQANDEQENQITKGKKKGVYIHLKTSFNFPINKDKIVHHN